LNVSSDKFALVERSQVSQLYTAPPIKMESKLNFSKISIAKFLLAVLTAFYSLSARHSVKTKFCLKAFFRFLLQHLFSKRFWFLILLRCNDLIRLTSVKSLKYMHFYTPSSSKGVFMKKLINLCPGRETVRERFTKELSLKW